MLVPSACISVRFVKLVMGTFLSYSPWATKGSWKCPGRLTRGKSKGFEGQTFESLFFKPLLLFTWWHKAQRQSHIAKHSPRRNLKSYCTFEAHNVSHRSLLEEKKLKPVNATPEELRTRTSRIELDSSLHCMISCSCGKLGPWYYNHSSSSEGLILLTWITI